MEAGSGPTFLISLPSSTEQIRTTVVRQPDRGLAAIATKGQRDHGLAVAGSLLDELGLRECPDSHDLVGTGRRGAVPLMTDHEHPSGTFGIDAPGLGYG